MRTQISSLWMIFAITVTAYAQSVRAQQTIQPVLSDDIQNGVQPADGILLCDNAPNERMANGESQTISYQQLQHRIPKQAIKEQRKGGKAFTEGHLQLAVAHFQKAIEIDPAFENAHNDLGVVLARLGQRTKAVEQFQRAVDLAPGDDPATANLSIALYLQSRYQEASVVARRALQMDPSLLYVRYILALSLVAGTETKTARILQKSPLESSPD